MKTKSSLLGFTLSELIVTIVILGILSTIAFLSYTSYTKTARDTDREGTLDKTITALELFHVQTGIYPVP
ncbi:MAG: prepilin-type N-terminal cleavage/methylation domain-containing protein [Candidatus Peribacteria bacterium]|nr:MAG: prepilin-type N-terminal cleavage/methylation domain-containing protein [Candidatus Peribacteria bacterium]